MKKVNVLLVMNTNFCSTKPDNVPQAYKMRDSSYYVEYSPETDGFVPMSSEN